MRRQRFNQPRSRRSCRWRSTTRQLRMKVLASQGLTGVLWIAIATITALAAPRNGDSQLSEVGYMSSARGQSSHQENRSIRKWLARRLDALFHSDKFRHLVENLLGVQAILF